MRIERIGGATLYLGDCREITPTLGDLETVCSDPPYGMAFQSAHRMDRHEAIANDKDAALLQWACALHADHSKYLFCRWNNLYDVPKPRSLVTWVKNNFSMGDLEHEHARQTEVALFYPGPNHAFGDGRPSDVVNAPRTGNNFHPTEKPVTLMQQIVRWTKGRVFDPFMGSGTTGVACMQENREFVGIEINEKYFDIACKRISEAVKSPGLF